MGNRWTIQDLEKLANKGLKVKGITPAIKPTARLPRVPKKDPEAVSHIKEVLWLLKLPFETEHRFHPTRKFRFDIALIEHKVAIEYEGIFNVAKSRHTSVEGFTNDCRKYNLAQGLGWKVLRYTAANYKEFYSELKTIIDERTDQSLGGEEAK